MHKRMLRIGESKALGPAKGGIKKNRKYGKPPRPFCVVFTGAYDFSRIMKLRENKDAYIDFVLGLFQISRDEKDLSGKYRLTNIFSEKEGDPVEVYPKGAINIAGLTESVAVIAIDKHGNESKPFIIKNK